MGKASGREGGRAAARSVPEGSSQDFHGLGNEIVYGPGPSRRYGTTLGINLAPAGRKACRFSCVYCQLGHSRGLPAETEYPTVPEVAQGLAARKGTRVDAIVMCGNGEPTLHPHFAGAVEELRRVRDRDFPATPIVCLTSGSELGRMEVVEALRTLDECSVKLDAGRCSTLRRIALAEGPVCVDWLTWKIRALRDAVVQTCFFDGPVSNSSDHEIVAWIAAVCAAAPRRVDVFTIDRPAPTSRLSPLSSERLHLIAARLRNATDLPVVVAE